MTSLFAHDTKLTSLNLRNNKKLSNISFYGTKISKLDLTEYNNLSIWYKVKAGSTINLAPYLGTGYEGEVYSENLIYDKTKNTVRAGAYGYLQLTKGEKRYKIYITVT